MYAGLYKRKRSFCKNVNFGSVALAFHYGSCSNVSLSRYTLQIYFVFKKLMWLQLDSNLQPLTTLDSNPQRLWLNGWMFVYELSGCGFESSCSHLNFRFRTYFKQGVPWRSGNYRVCIHSETRAWHNKNIQSLNETKKIG